VTDGQPHRRSKGSANAVCVGRQNASRFRYNFFQILTDRQFFDASKKLATKATQYFSQHLKHVAALPWEICAQNQLVK